MKTKGMPSPALTEEDVRRIALQAITDCTKETVIRIHPDGSQTVKQWIDPGKAEQLLQATAKESEDNTEAPQAQEVGSRERSERCSR